VTYAKGTEVPVSRSRDEIERTLTRYGASTFAYGWDDTRAVVEFVMDRRRIRLVVPLLDRAAVRTDPKTYRTRTPLQVDRLVEQNSREKWRALLLVVKAKLEAVESGISTLEDEFLAFVVLPNGQTVGEWTGPQLDDAYRSGGMLELLPGPAS
jgi:hypothetical protein